MKLPTPFLVIATQNPVEQSGTFELPEASSTVSCSCTASATRPAMTSR